MSRQTLFAWTEPTGPAPAYVDIARDAGGAVRLTVRGHRNAFGNFGEVVDVTLPPDAVEQLLGVAAGAAEG